MDDELIERIDGVNKDSVPQVVVKVVVKRNRGLKRDILKLLSDNPNYHLKPVDVFEALKSNSYGGRNPVSLNTVMSTMSQIKSKSPDLKEDSKDSPLVVSDGQDTSQL